MSTSLDLVYRYRLLLGKCDAGAGLDFDEIDQLLELEATFGVNREADTDLWACRRAFLRTKVSFSARVRNRKLGDTVSVIELGPGGVVCRAVPYVEEGDKVEFLFEDVEQGASYRFHATVAWIGEDGDDYICGFEFQGTPLKIRFGLDDSRADCLPAKDAESDASKTRSQDPDRDEVERAAA